MHKTASFVVAAAAAAAVAAASATPLRWICDWPEARSQTFSLYQGETAEFEPTFRVNGRVVADAAVAAVWYQTNGMDRAWWKIDGARFAPSNDIGAAAYRFFVEARTEDDILYRANGTLRMLPSPGFAPNQIELPVATLDFAAVDVVNAPWPAEIEAAVAPKPDSSAFAPAWEGREWYAWTEGDWAWCDGALWRAVRDLDEDMDPDTDPDGEGEAGRHRPGVSDAWERMTLADVQTIGGVHRADSFVAGAADGGRRVSLLDNGLFCFGSIGYAAILFDGDDYMPRVAVSDSVGERYYRFAGPVIDGEEVTVATTDDVAGRVRKPDFDKDSAGSHFVSWSSTASGNPMTNVHAVGSHTITLDADCMINFYGRTGGGTRTVQISVNGCVIHGGAVGADYVFNCFTICNAGDVVTITVESSAFRWINAAVRWL